MNPYYFNYLKQNSLKDYIDDIKQELDRRVYHYGDQFRINNDFEANFVIKFLRKQYRISRAVIQSKKRIERLENVVINNAYFGLDNDLKNLQFNPISVPWISAYNNPNLYIDLLNYQELLNNTTFDTLFDEKTIDKYNTIKSKLYEYYNKSNVKMLCLYNDICVFEKISLKIFKELTKPSYVFLHGIPGRYNNIDENRSDYLAVWGKKIKENYIKAGISEDKIFISGHPSYKNYDLSRINIKSSLDSVLVLSKSMFPFPQGNTVELADRGNLILYLLEVEEVLKRKNIKYVKFRPHPSENINWYYKFISKDFFRPDLNPSIIDSINKSTLVIGSTSTSFLNSILNNVNYIIYEPAHNNLDLINFPLNEPFDGNDERAVVANTKEELYEKISNNSIVNKEILLDYIEPNFDLSFLKN
jgi:hypothetical protein